MSQDMDFSFVTDLKVYIEKKYMESKLHKREKSRARLG